ncbi:F0F1 ATP synthase subunit delta [Rhizobium jaguaris]|uniref:ATP synthase subunit b n=1 Tax=Rhizobium jaguaris TaxID=1312183 RepID=A0A387G7W0_9HYPH|nr:F0F1 ATP synthase subunit delta [Rhizobium jaguaris]AYG63556.1 ATPase [Rhizobium jaguaris]
MHIDWWTLGLQTVNVLVLIWLLKRFLLQPVTAMIETRQQAIKQLLDEADAAKRRAVGERNEAAAEVARLAASRGDALKAVAAEAETAKAALLADAHAEAERLRAEAAVAREQARQSAAAAYAVEANGLAIEITRKLFDRLPDEARITGFIDGIAEAVAALPAESRAALGTVLPLRAARELKADEIQLCSKKLSETLGRAVEVHVVVDPNLIAGLEIDTPYARIRNSFRADLDRIATELTRHDNDRQ